MSNNIICRGGCGEIEEKKSRFIAHIEPIHSEEEAQSFIEQMRKQYWDARHNCYAYVIGGNCELQRFSDDGEPGGSAGRPMLEILLHEHLQDVVVVVTRYFGGTLLGVGGLVRAYQGAVQEGLRSCIIAQKEHGRKLSIDTDYNGLGKLQYLFSEKQIVQLDVSYDENVHMNILVPESKYGEIETAITDATSAKARITWDDEADYAVVDKEVRFL